MSPDSQPLVGVLLLAHGGPDSLADIEPFLRNIRGGRSFSPQLLEEITHRYGQIGGSSPLLGISRQQADALEAELNRTLRRGCRFRVYLGMRNWHPFIRETMEAIKQEGVTRLLAMCLAPQNSRMSVGQYFQHVQDAEKDLGLDIPATLIESWHREPLLIEAFAEKLKETMEAFHPAGGQIPVIFTAHSLPEKILAEGDPYDREVKETAAAVAERCGIENWRFAYQSQGATADPWLGPTVESVIDEFSRAGLRKVVVAPIGFLANHLEILYDVDIAFRQYAKDHGIELRRTPSLNESSKLVQAMAAVIEKNFPE